MQTSTKWLLGTIAVIVFFGVPVLIDSSMDQGTVAGWILGIVTGYFLGMSYVYFENKERWVEFRRTHSFKRRKNISQTID